MEMGLMAQGGGGGPLARFQPGYRPTKMCTFFAEGRCGKGQACTFAHDISELHPKAVQEQMGDAVLQPAPHLQDMASIEAAMTEFVQPDFAAEQSLSCLQGPREFSLAPTHLCAAWLRHPASCVDGDTCTLAHGLMELGLENNVGVTLRAQPGAAQVEVQVLQIPQMQRPKGKGHPMGLDTSYGKSFQKGAAAAAMFQQFASAPYGKGGAAPLALPGPGQGKGAEQPALQMPNRFAGKGGFMPTQLCQFWVVDPSTCKKGHECSFAHGVAELKPDRAMDCGVSRFLHTGFAPTKTCQFFEAGQCKRGLNCTFAHDVSELRGPPPTMMAAM